MFYFVIGCFLISTCVGETSFMDISDSARVKRQNHGAQQQQINYRPHNEAPAHIQQLLQFQQTPEAIVQLPAQPRPQLHAAPAPVHQNPEPQQHQLVQPAQYSPKILYNKAPEQPAYKGIQAVQSGIHPGPLPLHGQSASPTSTYTPKYKTSYDQQQKLDAGTVYKSIYNQQQQLNYNQQQQHAPAPNNIYRPAANVGQYQAQSNAQQLPKNLPPHIQQIIQNQRAYQG